MIKKDFKQKYFLFCTQKQIKTENFAQRFGNIENKSYICRIKITEL